MPRLQRLDLSSNPKLEVWLLIRLMTAKPWLAATPKSSRSLLLSPRSLLSGCIPASGGQRGVSAKLRTCLERVVLMDLL